jgi:cyclase
MKSLLLIVLSIVSISSLSAQDKAVEFSSFQLSDTVYMLKGSGGNVGISTGEDGLFIIDDQVKPVTAELLQAIRKISDKPVRIVVRSRRWQRGHWQHRRGDHCT